MPDARAITILIADDLTTSKAEEDLLLPGTEP